MNIPTMRGLFLQAGEKAIDIITPEMSTSLKMYNKKGYAILGLNPFVEVSESQFSIEDLLNFTNIAEKNEHIVYCQNRDDWAPDRNYLLFATAKSLLANREHKNTLTIVNEYTHLLRPGDCLYGGGVFDGFAIAVSGFSEKIDEKFATQLAQQIRIEYANLFHQYMKINHTNSAFV